MSSIKGKHVVIVLNDLRVGGSERQAVALARQLKKHGSEVTILGLATDGPLIKICKGFNIACVAGGQPINPGFLHAGRSVKRVRKLLADLKPDILLPYTNIPNVFCALAWDPGITQACIWNQRNADLNRISPKLEQKAIGRASGFLSNSMVGADFLSKTYGLDRNSITVIRNAVELPPPGDTTEIEEAFGIMSDTFMACMIGNVREPKDHKTLVDAWRILHPHVKANAREPLLILIGRDDTDLARSLKQEIQHINVLFTGFTDQVSQILSICNIGVFSSKNEGLPNGVLEAMAAGLPVVATDLPGVRECLPEEQHAYLSSVGDVKGMADNMKKIFDNPEQSEKLGLANQEIIKENFSLETMSVKTIERLEAMLS